jgi:hypothetical protein
VRTAVNNTVADRPSVSLTTYAMQHPVPYARCSRRQAPGLMPIDRAKMREKWL